MMKNITLITTLLCLVSFLSLAQIPNQISFQGVLTDPATGANVADGNYDFIFKVYDALTGGNLLWQENHQLVPVTNGIYSVQLGSEGVPLTLPFNKPYFLEVMVNNEILAPRIPFSSSPYSLGTKSLSGVDNVIPASGNVGIGTLTPNAKLDVNGDIRTNGEVNSTSTGTANMIPISYGNVRSDATIFTSSGNIKVTWNSTSLWYEISIANETYHFASYITVVTPSASSPIIATTSSVSGRLIVTLTDPSGKKGQHNFHFVVYKP